MRLEPIGPAIISTIPPSHFCHLCIDGGLVVAVVKRLGLDSRDADASRVPCRRGRSCRLWWP
jgi:hypothetical protein